MQLTKERFRVHSFAFGDVIGQGSFSKVLIARMKESTEYYAVKIINKTFIKKEGKEDSVMAEREALTLVNHPFIIHLHYSFQDSQNLYFVMTLCRGGTLWDLMKALRLPGRGCDPVLIHFYMAEIISAVDYLHNTAHFIHRDLKPENILITEYGHVMLSDFGTITKRDTEVTNRSDAVCGTILYLAPEVIQGENITDAVDIWSIGCILYLLYTGCFIFEGEDKMNVLDSIEHFCVDMLEFPEYIPSEAQDLIRRMLDYNPSSRITASEILKHPYFEGIDFSELQNQKPPYVPPFAPLPVICDDELENELNVLRGSFDATYREELDLKKEAILKLMNDDESVLYSSPVIQLSKSTSRNRELVLTASRKILILSSNITSIKTVIQPSQLARVDLTPKGFNLAISHPNKVVFKFATPKQDQSVWINCIERIMKHR